MESVALRLDRGNELLLEMGNEALGKIETIGDEDLAADGHAEICIGNAPRATESLQRVFVRWIAEIGGKALRFEEHPGRRAVDPALHRPAEDTMGDAQGAKMRRER